jgi:transposase
MTDYARERTAAGCVGVDLGITHLATLSTGAMIAGPKPLKHAQNQLRRANRRLHRRHRGSANRQKAQRRVARLHARVAHIRTDALHKLTSRMCRENQAISIEDLHVKGMIKNTRLARSISDMAGASVVGSWSTKRLYTAPSCTSSAVLFPLRKCATVARL